MGIRFGELKKLCMNCGKSVRRLKRHRCFTCYNYLSRTGNERPARLWNEITVCQNPNCDRPLKTDPSSRKNLCNACYLYQYKYTKLRPIELCQPIKTRGWCGCGNQIILTTDQINNHFQTTECFVCRMNGTI